MKRRAEARLAALVAFSLALWTASPVCAQTSQAALQGLVTSQTSDAPIAKALVIQRNLLTNTQGYRYTNEQGYYSFTALPPGPYTVRVDALGFQPEERSPVVLPVASRIELNFALQGGAARPATARPATAPPATPPSTATASNILAIMYGADAAVPQAVLIRLPVSQIETLVGSLSSLIGENKILELPLAGRDVYTLLVLQPDVSSDNATARGLGFSVNGNPASSSNLLLDGVDNNDLQVTGPATRVSADAVKEYRMTTNNFTAEFGRNSGFIANVITRSGTNQFHGTLFEFFNHDLLNANSFANNWQGLAKEPFRNNQYGASIGGPAWRNRLFFFGNFEQARSSTRSQPLTLFFPGPALTSLAAPGSIARRLLTQFPPPSGPSVSGGLLVSQNFRFLLPQVNSFGLGRADYSSASGRHRVSARYAMSQQTQEHFVTSPYPDLEAPLVIRGQNLSLNHTTDLYGGTNELKFGFSRNSVRILRPHPEVPTLISTDGVRLPGSEAAYDYSFQDSVFHILDNFSRLRGSHALTMGVEWRPYLHDSLLSTARDGQYVFGSVYDFIFDSPSSLRVALNRETRLPAANSDFWRYYFQNEMAAFFQDDWKLARHLTLNLGIRWEYFGAPSPRNGTRDYNFVFGPGADIGQRIANGSVQQADLFRPDRNNFGPRFGFAYDLFGSGRTVLRGGYGVYFDRVFNNFWMDARADNLSFQSLSTSLVPPFTRPFRYTIPVQNALDPVQNLAPTVDVAVDQKLRTPYAQSWFVGWQQELTPNLRLEINQTGSLGRKLATTDAINRDFSLPATADNPSGRFNPNEPYISYRSNQGYSDHVALQVALNRRWSQNLQFQASYTLGRTRDVQSDPLGRKVSAEADPSKRLATVPLFEVGPLFLRQFDPRSDYGHSDFDQRHNLVFNFIAQMPYVLGMPRPMSGWQFAAVAGFRSGFPFTVWSGTPADPETVFVLPGRGLAGVPSQFSVASANRADYWGSDPSQAFLSKPTEIAGGETLLDPAHFANPPSNRLGNTPRNMFYGPGFWNVDFSMSRSFAVPQLGEGASLQFRAEFFNVFNHTNLDNPAPELGTNTFGDASFGRQGAGSSSTITAPLKEQPRRIQFALKLYF